MVVVFGDEVFDFVGWSIGEMVVFNEVICRFVVFSVWGVVIGGWFVVDVVCVIGYDGIMYGLCVGEGGCGRSKMELLLFCEGWDEGFFSYCMLVF